MKIIQQYATKNGSYTNNKKFSPRGVVFHSMGVGQENAFSIATNNFNKSGTTICVHAVLNDNPEAIYQLLPFDTRAAHVGGSANDTHVGFEMCEPNGIKYTGGSSFTDPDPSRTKAYILRAYKVAVEFIAYLCTKHGWDPLKDGVVISHAEAYKRGIGSNHGDVDHMLKYVGLSMDQCRKDVKAMMSGQVPPQPAPAPTTQYNIEPCNERRKSTANDLNIRTSPTSTSNSIGRLQNGNEFTATKVVKNGQAVNGNATWYEVNGAGWCSGYYTVAVPAVVQPIPVPAPAGTNEFKIKVAVSCLNIRKGAGTNFDVTGKITDKGTYTIVEAKAGQGAGLWGKLKSGAGWIAIDASFVTRI